MLDFVLKMLDFAGPLITHLKPMEQNRRGSGQYTSKISFVTDNPHHNVIPRDILKRLRVVPGD